MAETQLDRIERKLDALLAHLGVGRAPASAAAPSGRREPPRVSPDSDLDSEYGNPSIRKDPRDWTGESYVGCNFSDAPPEYLEMLAASYDWRAGKDDEAGANGELDKRGKPKSGYYPRLDAARARGWAQRKRNGWGAADPASHGQPAGGGSDAGDMTDIPFLSCRDTTLDIIATPRRTRAQ